MKKVLLISLSLISLSAVSQWNTITSIPPGEYNKIKADDNSILWIVGKNLIMKSNDLGNNWSATPLDNLELADLQIINNSLTYYYSFGGIYKSIDSGQSFYDTITFFAGCDRAYFLDESIGFEFGFNRIYKTFNGGISGDTVWQNTLFGYDYAIITSMIFINDSTGFCCGWERDNQGGAHLRGFIMKTTDQGNNWTFMYHPPFWSGSFQNIQILSDNENFIYCFDEDNRIYTSEDQGITWFVNTSLLPNILKMRDLSLLNEDSSFSILCYEPNYLVDTMFIFEVLFSENHFESWYSQFKDTITWNDPYFDSEPFKSLLFLNDSTGFITGDYLLLKTTNGGGYNPHVTIPESLILNNSDINIYPNPTSNQIRVESSETLKFLSLYNSFGKLMLKKKVDDRQFEIPVTAYPAGVYMIRVETDKQVISRKVLVIH
jgi:photosystem II stability/assembly factor-like uncharacterized protein